MYMCSDAHICTCTNTHRHNPISHVRYQTVLWRTQWEFMLGLMLSWACSVDIVYFLVLWWWYHGLKRLGKKHLFALHFQIILHNWESQGWNSRQELEAVTQAETIEHYCLAFSPLFAQPVFLNNPGPPIQAPTHHKLKPLTSTVYQEYSHRLAFRPIWWMHFSSWEFLPR